MRDDLIGILKIVASVSVALIVFTEGLRIGPNMVLAYFRERYGLMLRSLAATLLLVPAAALVLILVLKPAAGVALGLAILVACPPAPLMIKAAPQIGGASQAFMASLHLSLALLALGTVPLVLRLLSLPLGFSADVHLGAMMWILSRTILLPIIVGMAVHAFFPKFSGKFGRALGKAGSVGLLVVVLFALVAFFPALLSMDPWSYLVIAAVGAVGLAIGHFLGSQDPNEKTSLAVECAVRHPVLALTIATANLPPHKALPVVIPCVLTFIVVAAIYLVFRGKHQGAKITTTTGPNTTS
jgi:bile acid:Na+ symporter, BASS family